jgi:hypothetical protein
MKEFTLGGLVWRQGAEVLSYRQPWWIYLLAAMVSLVVLSLEVRYSVSLVRNPPSMYVGGGRHTPATEITWQNQTSPQRCATVGFHLLFILVPSLLSMAFLVGGAKEMRSPMLFSKSAGQVRKGKNVLAKLSDVKCVAVVHWPHGLGRKSGGRATQVFIRFSAEPWSILVDASGSIAAAEGVAGVLAQWLCVPIVYDPVVKVRPARVGRGFEVVTEQRRSDVPAGRSVK